jgi:hypothetical protein
VEYKSAKDAWLDICEESKDDGVTIAVFSDSITDEEVARFPLDPNLWTPELEVVCERYAFEVNPGITVNRI